MPTDFQPLYKRDSDICVRFLLNQKLSYSDEDGELKYGLQWITEKMDERPDALDTESVEMESDREEEATLKGAWCVGKFIYSRDHS